MDQGRSFIIAVPQGSTNSCYW